MTTAPAPCRFPIIFNLPGSKLFILAAHQSRIYNVAADGTLADTGTTISNFSVAIGSPAQVATGVQLELVPPNYPSTVRCYSPSPRCFVLIAHLLWSISCKVGRSRCQPLRVCRCYCASRHGLEVGCKHQRIFEILQ